MRLTMGEYPYFVFARPFKNEKLMEFCSKREMYQLIANKLGQLEDIEEELGIDLLTLIKALTDCIVVKNEDGKIETFWACPRFQISVDKSDSWILYGPVEEQKYVSIKDYGKTWALTKDELI